MMFNNNHGMWNYWIFGIILLILIAIYVANDAARYGENGFLWALVVIFMPMMGLLVYVVVRSTWTRDALISKKTTQATQTRPPRVQQVQAPVTGSDKQQNDENNTYFCTSCGVESNSSTSYCNNCGVKFLDRK